MTEPRWQHLDHRETPDGGQVVYHWPMPGERVCETSGRVMLHALPGAQCAEHTTAEHPCPSWMRWPGECQHAVAMVGDNAVCTVCGIVGVDVTAEMGA